MIINRRKLLRAFTYGPDGTRIPEVDVDNFPVRITLKDVKQIIREQPAVNIGSTSNALSVKSLFLDCMREVEAYYVDDLLKQLDSYQIYTDGKLVGILLTQPHYIHSVYVLPEYRRQGLAKEAVITWYLNRGDQYVDIPVKLDVVDKNKAAVDFWHCIFDLHVEELDSVSHRYTVIGLKHEKGNA